MDNKNMQGVEAGGFLFLNGADAALAEKEQKQIAYLEKKLDYQNPEQILAVLQKLIEERSFKTPIGIFYLKKMQDYLMKLNSVRLATKKRQEIQKSNHKISVLLNMILVIALIVMFWVTLQSETPNMINYRIAIENKYAAWEQELGEREERVREQERELATPEQ